MASSNVKPHAICMPFPAQGHINPMLKLAKLLHSNAGFHITFVNTEYNHRRLLDSMGPGALDGIPGFEFETIPDGLTPSDANVTQEIAQLFESIPKNCLRPFRDLVQRINTSNVVPPVSCIVSDSGMNFTLDVAAELGIPEALFSTMSACGALLYAHFPYLLDKGLVPLKDASYLANGYLDTQVEGIPGMEGIRLKDFPTFARTTDINDIFFNYLLKEVSETQRAKAVIINTFEALEKDVLNSLSKLFPPIFTIGPLHLMANRIPASSELKRIGSSLWREREDCLDWLNTKEPNSVVYVNFGSLAVMSSHQLEELGWGLRNSKKHFLWIIRPDLVAGVSYSSLLPQDRGMVASWCPQEQVLSHPAVGVFLSHMGWNSTIESVAGGVPFACHPLISEQKTNCWFACNKWGVGMEIDGDVKREEVEKLVVEMLEGDKGKGMRKKAKEWKAKAEEATCPGGSSCNNFDGLVKLLQGRI